MRIVVGTRNPAKVWEIEQALGGAVEVGLAPSDISPQRDVDLAGLEIEAIAVAKAMAWSRAVAMGGGGAVAVLATDGGLLIPALGKTWDPARTRRFAGEAATDRERADALLALTADLRGDERQIGWREAVTVARDGEVVASFVAESPTGVLARDYDPALVEAGEGFWIPALWICPEFGGKRLAELTAAERRRRPDHWQRLGRELRAFLAAQ